MYIYIYIYIYTHTYVFYILYYIIIITCSRVVGDARAMRFGFASLN